MPLLAREPDCYPSDLFDRLAETPLPSDSESTDGVIPCTPVSLPGVEPQERDRWWVVRTLSRREKDLMRRLTAADVAYYTPIITRRSRSASGRVRASFVPLFSGYVFLHGTEDDRRAALTTNCIASILAVEDQCRLLGELLQIRKLLDSDRPITPEEKLVRGQAVRVVTGPLRGQEGVVIERLGKRRLLVTVELLQRGASVDLDECDVEPI
jgi:transcription antitermination factor NusG